ncbi:hypothetical protein A3K86_19025 [Photobacterium jeanii]|uniref:Type VI secretion protein n=1 Tax=Photobacterium jeanii TaxID=858640 RepID=A0A178K1T6_9GAMM|nr:type VI secretion system baseplate subunit TssG [Photobacterium jeanii]OAN11067.1 hypothetical protein A3K86_19025 [Photobacterium jeanii]PST90581.1 type VI secretion system baseplate subunit TssG [Photobacterium jeanii]
MTTKLDPSIFNGEGFFDVVFALHRYFEMQQDKFEIGTDAFVDDEPVRFVTSQHLGFAAKEVDVQQSDQGKTVVEVSSMGLTGVSGVLPRHYSEMILQRAKKKDYAFRDFLDLFNHRLISLHYKAWEKYQFPVHYQRHLWGEENTLHTALKALTGAKQIGDIYWGGLLAKTVRSSASLKAILAETLQCEVEIEEFVGRWVPLQESEQTMLGTSFDPEGQHAQLGNSTVLGTKVWDVNAAIRVVLRVNNPDLAGDLIHKGKRIQQLDHLAKHFVPQSTQVNWQLQTQYRDLPQACLNGKSQLGLSAMLGMPASMASEPVTISIS